MRQRRIEGRGRRVTRLAASLLVLLAAPAPTATAASAAGYTLTVSRAALR